MPASSVGTTQWVGAGVAALGGLILLLALFIPDWYGAEPRIAPLEIGASFLTQVEPPPEVPEFEIPEVEVDLGAWDEQGFLGTIANLIMLAASLWALVAVGLLGIRAGTGTGLGSAELATVTAAAGVAAAIMILLRILFPVGEIGGIEVDTSLKFGIFMALIGAVLIALGGVMWRREAPAGPVGPARPEPPPPPPGEPPPPPPAQPPQG
jgi:hypothetical protein